MIRPAAAVVLFALLAAAVAPAARSAPFGARPVTTVDGEAIPPAELAGRVVLVDFWATWCAPCLAQLPALREAWERHREEGFLLVGVSLDRAHRSQVLSFLRRHSIDWPQVFDGTGFDGDQARRFGVESVPRSFLFDRAGRLVAADLDGDALLAVLPALLAAGPPR